jgi:hypothetical protein
MEDDVAEHLGTDIILPESSVKPEYKGPSRLLDLFRSESRRLEVRTYNGPIVFGIRDVSENREFESSYTLIEHVSWDTLKTEILPHALAQVRKLKAAADEGNYEELLVLLGTTSAQQRVDVNDPANTEYTSREATVVEAVLKVDPTGYLVKHPYINQQLQKLLARWTFKLCTGGGFRMPAFALADDGFLVLHEGQIVTASDWLPLDCAITSVPAECGLVVRYPIRMFEDLLPYRRFSVREIVDHLRSMLEAQQGVRVETLDLLKIIEHQILLKGTLTLHSQTAARNGGDFDFDLVCVVEGDKFPKFAEDRFRHEEQAPIQKEKVKKQRSPWWNLVHGIKRVQSRSALAKTFHFSGRFSSLSSSLTTSFLNSCVSAAMNSNDIRSIGGFGGSCRADFWICIRPDTVVCIRSRTQGHHFLLVPARKGTNTIGLGRSQGASV